MEIVVVVSKSRKSSGDNNSRDNIKTISDNNGMTNINNHKQGVIIPVININSSRSSSRDNSNTNNIMSSSSNNSSSSSINNNNSSGGGSSSNESDRGSNGISSGSCNNAVSYTHLTLPTTPYV